MRDLQGNSLAKGHLRSLGLGILWLGGDNSHPASPLLPSSHATRKDRARTQKQLPDLSFPEPGLKGAVVPFAWGETGQAGGV